MYLIKVGEMQPKTVTLKIIGMECPSCAMRLEQLEDRLAGVEQVEASYRKAEMKVRFCEQQVSLEQIKAEVARLGYQVCEGCSG